MPCGATQDGRAMVERDDRMWSTGEGNGKPLQYSCLQNPRDSMKRQNDRILKGELPRSVGDQNATGNQWWNNSRKNEGMEPKQKQYPVVDVTGDRSKVWCCKEQYCVGTWNVRSMNQGKLEVVKQVMARVNVDSLGISELKWTGMGEFNSDEFNSDDWTHRHSRTYYWTLHCPSRRQVQLHQPEHRHKLPQPGKHNRTPNPVHRSRLHTKDYDLENLF